MSASPPIQHHIALLRVDHTPQSAPLHPRHIAPHLPFFAFESSLHRDHSDWRVDLIDMAILGKKPKAIAEEIIASGAKIAIIHAVTWSLSESLKISRQLKSAGLRTIAVGQQVLHAYYLKVDDWHHHYDLSLAGDIEEFLPKLLPELSDEIAWKRAATESQKRLDAGELYSVDDPKNLPQNFWNHKRLSQYPFPFPVTPSPVSKTAYIQCSWGCPRRCGHCTHIVRKSSGYQWKVRPIEQIIFELQLLKEMGAQFISIEDDDLLVDKATFIKLCDAIVAIGLNIALMANARPDELDEDRIKAATAAGFTHFKVGVESGSEVVLSRINKSRHPQEWINHCRSGFKLLKRYHINVTALMLIGMPDETLEDLEQSRRLIKELRPEYLQLQIYRLYPDVPIRNEYPENLHSQGDDYHYGEVNSSCSNIPADQLPTLQAKFYRNYYLSLPYVVLHLSHFWRHYIPFKTENMWGAGLRSVLNYLRR